jgi:cell wall-associated NlpC family hydrolase
VRLRHISTLGTALTAAFAFAGPAWGFKGGTGAPSGGTASDPGPSSPSGSTTPTAPAAPGTPRAPIVSRRSQSPYTGPVYELTDTNQLVPYAATVAGADPTGGTGSGSATHTLPRLVVPGNLAAVIDGLAAAPQGAPAGVQNAIWAANAIIGKPYVYGGGHTASFRGRGYDCSGTVSYALHGASLLRSPLDSSGFMRWGKGGQGSWITIFSNPGHAYVDIAGVRLDTSAADDPSAQQGPRWRPLRTNNRGYRWRHPASL